MGRGDDRGDGSVMDRVKEWLMGSSRATSKTSSPPASKEGDRYNEQLREFMRKQAEQRRRLNAVIAELRSITGQPDK